jgi:hypothetical protein
MTTPTSPEDQERRFTLRRTQARLTQEAIRAVAITAKPTRRRTSTCVVLPSIFPRPRCALLAVTLDRKETIANA